MRMIKIQDAQPMGEYKETSVDAAKKEAAFRIVQTSPYYIRWADGRGETVNARKLKQLQTQYPSWVTDF